MAHDLELSTLQLLAGLGLEITPHSDLNLGWGYTWQGQDWIGPFTTPYDALRAALTDAVQANQFRSKYSWTQVAQPGELWRNAGGDEGWERIVGLGIVDDEEATMLASLHALYQALDTLRGIETSEILIPGPSEKWEQALRVGYRAYPTITALLEIWHDELETHYDRKQRAEDLFDQE
jgi:hypothetical protein